jgi:flagellar hook-length control protein FliK
MTMASTTVNSTVGTTGFDVSAVMNAKAVSNSKNVTSSTQSFGSVLNSTTQNSKSDQKTAATTKDEKSTSSTNASSDSNIKDTSSQQDTKVKDDTAKDAAAKDATATDTKDTIKDDVESQVKDTDNQVAEKTVAEEPEADDTIIEEIATALNFILDQVKELIGVDDDAIAATMDDLGLNQGDLLNSDNLAQLVTALSGEESTISLVANEDLYSKLQSLTEVVDTQFETVLDNTGIGEEELNQVLENFAVEENPVEGNPVEENIIEENAIEANQVSNSQENVASVEPEENEPIVIVQDNTTKPATTYSKLQENQQDTTDLVSENQSSNSKTEKNQNNQSKDYSENQSFSQNQETALNENVSEVTESTTSYTSDSTESIMRQLADTVKLIKDDNLTQMELQLHPASLGTVNVSLITKGGAVTAQFTTQNEQVRAAIESQAAQLQQDLENQGVKVEAIEVAVESHQMERNLDQENSRKEKEGEQTEESMRATRRANINLRTLGEDGDVLEEIQGADEATRIAMELMSANGNTMDMLA